jgi:hypothetical protein
MFTSFDQRLSDPEEDLPWEFVSDPCGAASDGWGDGPCGGGVLGRPEQPTSETTRTSPNSQLQRWNIGGAFAKPKDGDGRIFLT